MSAALAVSGAPERSAFSDPEVLRQVFVAAAAGVAGAIAVALGVWWRRLRWPLIIGGAALALFFAPAFGAFFEAAYPTSFFASPTRYAATSIVQGRQIFEERCASCHGADGRGADGENGRRHGRRRATRSRGQRHLHACGRRSVLVDPEWRRRGNARLWRHARRGRALEPHRFIHANADAARLQALAGKVIARGYPTPNFSVQCGDDTSMAADDLRGKVVHAVVAAGADPQALTRLRARDRAHDVRTILLEGPSLEPPEGDPEACVASDPSVAETIAIYRGVPAAS